MGQSTATQTQQQSSRQMIKQKQQIQFQQTDFIRETQGSIQLEYQILSPYLKQNQFYQLRKAIHLKTKLIRAVYIVNKYKVRTSERQLLEQQISKLKHVDHPNINKIYELFKDSHRFLIVMEFCYGDSLATILQRQKEISERRAAAIVYQLLNVMGHCHRRGIIHGDLNLENMMFNSQKQDIIKISDFSISKMFRIEDIIEQSKGKAFLSSPQALNNQKSPKSDIWQIGMVLYILLCGSAPILGNQKNRLARKIIYCKYLSDIDIPHFNEKKFQLVSKEAKEFIRSLLRLNPNERPAAQSCLEHPWIIKYYKPPFISTINLKRCLMQCYHFNPLSKLQEATWTFFVSALAPFSQKQNILHVFNLLDEKRKGELGWEQIFTAFKTIYAGNQGKAEFLTNLIFKRLRRDKISFSHFLTISTNRLFLITQANIKKIFQIFDQDDSGQITVAQLKHVLGSSKEVTEQIWLDLMKQADVNSDGMISFNQFKCLMKSLLSRQNQELFQEQQNRDQKITEQSQFEE